jgi:hypothetical protein
MRRNERKGPGIVVSVADAADDGEGDVAEGDAAGVAWALPGTQ